VAEEEVAEEEAVETVAAAEVAEVEEVFPLFNHSHRWEHQEDKHETSNQWDSSLPSSTEIKPSQKGSLTY
jgi:hypothetical protein